MNKTDASAAMPRFIMLASIAVVLGGLYFAQEVLIPLALAILLSFLLAPLVKRLERLHLPRAVAVVVTVLIAFALLTGIGWVVVNQVGDLKSELPALQSKIQSIRGPGGLLSRVRNAGKEVHQALSSPTTQPEGGLPVRIMNPDSSGNQESPLDLLKPVGSFLLGPVGTGFIVTVFAIFMLLQREDLRDRLIRLVGRNRLTTTTQALDDAAERVSRYLLMQSIVNGSVGVTILVLLWGVGKVNGTPFPAVALWGLLACLLRFIPYLGIWVAAATPVVLALAIFNFRAAFETLCVYGGVEILAGNVVEPLLFGASTGIATLAVLVAAAFWTWLWGPVGLLLSTPLTVCLVVMGKYVPQLEFLTILLAEEPALAPPDRIYQRLLATDQEEAVELVEEYATKMPLEELYETVLVPVLVMADQDLNQNDLDEDQHRMIQHAISDMVDEQGDHMRLARKKAEDEKAEIIAESNGRVMLPRGCVVNVICLPASTDSDQISATMLAHLLELRGYCVQVPSVTQLASEMVETVERTKADVVAISALPPAAVTHARYLCKRLHGKLPEVQMMVGLWNSGGDLKRASERIAAVRSVQVAANFSQAIEQIHQMAQPKMMEVHAAG